MFGSVSETEREFIRQGCALGIREDGRALRDHRPLLVEVDVLPHLNGSSRVKVAGMVEVLCSVKLQVQELQLGSPPRSALDVTVEISPSCSLKLDSRRLDDTGSHLAQQLKRVFLGSLNTAQGPMCIVPSLLCWHTQIDLLVSKLDGDPLDVCSIAVYSALKSTQVPRVDVILGPSGLPVDYEVVGDPASSINFPSDELPICTTFTKIGDSLVIDASANEHACASTAFLSAVNRRGHCCGLMKLLGGGTFIEHELMTVLVESRVFVPSLMGFIDTNTQFYSTSRRIKSL